MRHAKSRKRNVCLLLHGIGQRLGLFQPSDIWRKYVNYSTAMVKTPLTNNFVGRLCDIPCSQYTHLEGEWAALTGQLISALCRSRCCRPGLNSERRQRRYRYGYKWRHILRMKIQLIVNSVHNLINLFRYDHDHHIDERYLTSRG